MQQCARSKIPLPARIANAPELWPGLELYYVAFLDLTSCRALGYGTEGPIPWLAIDDYAYRRGLDDEQRDDLHFHVPHMDGTYLQFKAKAAKG